MKYDATFDSHDLKYLTEWLTKTVVSITNRNHIGKYHLATFSLVMAVILFLTSCSDERTKPQNTNQWELLGLEGKLVHNLTLAGNHLYACAGRDGLYRTPLDEDNNTWEYLGLGDTTLIRARQVGVTSVLVDESTGRIMAGYADQHLRGHGIWITEDQGITWAPSDSGIGKNLSSQVQSLYRLPSHPGTLFVGMSTTLYRSINGGKSWELIWGNTGAGGLGINAITNQTDEPKYLLAGGQTGRFAPFVLKSPDNGLTWEMIYQNFPPGPVGVGVDNVVFDIAIDPEDKNTFYVGMIAMILKTADGGETWMKILDWENGIGHHEKISMNPNDSQELFVTGIWLHHTLDGGMTWENIDSPVPDQNVFFALAVDWDRRVFYVSLSYPGFCIYRRTF